jgi:hypothetical protein
MGIFDNLFSPFTGSLAQDAAQAQIGGLQTGYNLAVPQIQSAIQAIQSGYGTAVPALQSNYTAALQPLLTNWGTAQGGVGALKNVLGLGGAAGTQSALQALQETPGYNFQLQQGQNALAAQAAKSGMLRSGNFATALANYNQGVAGQTYQNYVNNLMPFLNLANQSAGGIGNIYTGLGTGLANLATGQGSQIAGQYGNLANLGWSLGAGTGQAQASADLAQMAAAGNIWNALAGVGGAAMKYLA